MIKVNGAKKLWRVIVAPEHRSVCANPAAVFPIVVVVGADEFAD